MNSKNILNVLNDEFIKFATPVITNNLPSVRDGLLAVHRKVIHALNKNRVTSDKNYIKMLRASSYAMVYYIYGDMPLTKAMKNMANNSLNYFYLDPKGSFGDKRKKYGVGASPRYIECRLSKYSEDMLQGINKNNVEFKRNFDDTEDEPIYLPSVIPNVLSNPSQSIAVGWASKMPSHNLISLVDSIISYSKYEDIDKAIDILQCPDFIGTGGQIIYDKDTFNKIYKTGKGSFTMLGKGAYDEKTSIYSITEVPYETNIETIEEKLRSAYDKDLFKEIVDIQDVSGIQGIQLDIYLKKNTNINHFISKLRKYTPFESKFSCNFTLLDLDNKTPMLMSLEDIYIKWLTHRKQCITKELNFDINKLLIELNKLYGLKSILTDLDKAIEIIRNSKSEKEAINELIQYFNLNKEQAEYISTIKLININKDWIHNKTDSIEKLESEINRLKEVVNSEEDINSIIISQLEDIKKKYGQPRKTEIIYEDTVQEIDEEELIEDYNCKVFLTKDGYFKKVKLTSIKGNQVHKLKEDDYITHEQETTNKSVALIFTSTGNCHKLYLQDIEDTKISNIGTFLYAHLNLQEDEKIVGMITTTDYSENVYIGYKNGQIACIKAKSYQTKQKRSKLENSLNLNSEVINIFKLDKPTDIVCISNINKVLIVDSDKYNPKGAKNSQGNKCLTSKNDSYMIKCYPLTDKVEEFDYKYYKINGSSGTGKYLRKGDEL